MSDPAMKSAAVEEIRQISATADPDAMQSPIRRFAASFWLNYLFWHVEHFPWMVRKAKWFFLWFAVRFSHVLRKSTAMNARRIYGRELSPAEAQKFTTAVVSSFYDFIFDIGQALKTPTERLIDRIESVQGSENYDAARAMKKGAIVATAHIGSFEAATASLLQHDRKIHVVFKRDLMDRFEIIRAALRKHLGVIEAPIDDGWTVWMRLRNALLADEVVMLQADRVLPGQKGVKTPFLHGHLLLPTGPIKLAVATGAPIVPVFSIRTAEGKIRIFVEPAIVVGEGDAEFHRALQHIAKVLEKYIGQFAEQWLMVQPAFCEDAMEGM
jgi:phosphatidylinositol dimannoside acyltransferase